MSQNPETTDASMALADQAQSNFNYGLNTMTNAITNKKNREYSKEMVDYSYAKDLEQWNRTNAYNSPEQQMDRYKEAGLNPNLVYGSQGSNGNATQIVKSGTPGGEYSRPDKEKDNLMAYQTLRNLQQQNAYLWIQTENSPGKQNLEWDGLVKQTYALKYAGMEGVKGIADYQLDAAKLNNDLKDAQIQQYLKIPS